MIKICLVSLGCVKNLVDSEAILAIFRSGDFEIVSAPKDSDVIIVNTCGFILDAKIEGIDTILEMAKYKKKLVVIGCLVERYYDELIKELPEVDLFVRFKDEYQKLPSLISDLLKLDKPLPNIDFSSRIISTDSYTAYLKISEGCDNFCSFCSIPYIRGRFKSEKMDKLVNDAKNLVKQGVKEIIVIGQDPTSYGKDLHDGSNLTKLLEELDKIEGLEFIRCLYLYPDGITDELLSLYKNSPKFPHYFDIPIQHASNKILKAMNRKHSKEDVINIYNKIKAIMPDAILRTTLIVGFPNETIEDFIELKEFISKYKFNHLGVFTYSREEGTVAYKMKNQIKKDIKEKRKEEIMSLQADISYQLNKELIGKRYRGLIIGK
ncbi:MAG: 30S ribosomal protein S12 methylthiotransferase RimO, partial [Mollicutes bacterium]|nr:30S ribosomal protein S12 methylthiotransferase RimO [Mollicutes bacterium]